MLIVDEIEYLWATVARAERTLAADRHSTDEDEYCEVLEALSRYALVDGFADCYSSQAAAALQGVPGVPAPETLRALALRISAQWGTAAGFVEAEVEDAPKPVVVMHPGRTVH